MRIRATVSCPYAAASKRGEFNPIARLVEADQSLFNTNLHWDNRNRHPYRVIFEDKPHFLLRQPSGWVPSLQIFIASNRKMNCINGLPHSSATSALNLILCFSSVRRCFLKINEFPAKSIRSGQNRKGKDQCMQQNEESQGKLHKTNQVSEQ